LNIFCKNINYNVIKFNKILAIIEVIITLLKGISYILYVILCWIIVIWLWYFFATVIHRAHVHFFYTVITYKMIARQSDG